MFRSVSDCVESVDSDALTDSAIGCRGVGSTAESSAVATDSRLGVVGSEREDTMYADADNTTVAVMITNASRRYRRGVINGGRPVAGDFNQCVA